MTEQDYEILDNDEPTAEQQGPSDKEIKTKRRELWIALILSFALDAVSTSIAWALCAVFPIAPVVVEEAIESLLSNLVAKYGLKQDLGIWANLIGFLPIPGVTALTIGCINELVKSYRKD